MQDETILEITDLNICFEMREGTVNAVNGVNFSVKPGEVLGIVGESGSGKSLSARSIMNLLPRNATVTNGSVKFRKSDGEVVDILAEKRESRKMRELRGGHVGMIFQEPMTALSPVHSIGKQIMTTLSLHTALPKKAQVERAADLLAMVQMPKPMEMLKKYPHQLSGGMRQRAMIAMALSCNPSLLLADEPTTALDVTTEAQILDLIMSLQDELNMAVIFITHNFGVVAEIADRVSVMYLGNAVETAAVDDIFYNPKHPYTRALLQSIPRLDGQKRRRLQTIEGMVPDPFNLPTGCVFHTRCAEKMAGKCTSQIPELTYFENDQMARCHLHQA